MPRSKLSPRKDAVQARGRRTVEAVLEAAAQVFSRRGYASGTTNHIAERAGVSIGTLYQYFPNKDAILVALVRRHMSEATALLQGLLAQAGPALPLEGLIGGFIDAMVEFHTRDPKLHRVLFEEAPHPREVRRALVDLEESLADGVERLLLQHPQVTVPDPSAAAYLVVHVVEGLTHHWVLHAPAQLDDRAFSRELVKMLHAYLAGGGSPRPAGGPA